MTDEEIARRLDGLGMSLVWAVHNELVETARNHRSPEGYPGLRRLLKRLETEEDETNGS